MSFETLMYNLYDMIAYAKSVVIGGAIVLAIMLIMLFVLVAKISDLQEEIKALKKIVGEAPGEKPTEQNAGNWPE